MKSLILVGLGGAVGSVLRHLSSTVVNRFSNTTFPLGTFVVNIIGCLIIGMLVSAAGKYQLINNDIKLLLITGFCGGFTTFSTFSYENIQLLNTGNISSFALNIIASVVLGIVGVWLGLIIIK